MLLTLVVTPRVPASAALAPPLQRFHQVHRAMGTEFALDLYSPDESSATHTAAAAFDEIDRLEALLSNYRTASELSRISQRATLGPIVTDPETFSFLERSLFWSRQSNGAFDITVGPLLRAWGFFFHGGRIPAAAELVELGRHLGWQRVHLDAVTRTVLLDGPAPMELDPGSIGKGFAVDAAIRLLRQQGITTAFLSAGNSTLFGLGTPPGSAGWPVSIPDPHHPGHIASTILLRDTSLSTGACTEKFFIHHGHRFCHIFDPRTLRPVEGMLQATVIDPSATDSDALSTVAFVDPGIMPRLLAGHPERRMLVFGQPPARVACLALNWNGDPCRDTPPKEPHR